jgi:hypothetical protein
MSITWFSRGRGLIVRCNGTHKIEGHCPNNAKYQCGLIIAKHVRAWIKTHDGWGRGLRSGYKRRDLCPTCMPIERELLAKKKADRAEAIKKRDEAKKAKLAAAPLPKKPRKRKASASDTSSAPSADSVPAPAT